MGIDINQLSPWAQKQIARKLAANMRQNAQNNAQALAGENEGNSTPPVKNQTEAKRTAENSILRITIELPPVTKKNSQRIVKHGERYIPIPSKAYKQYENSAGDFISRVSGLKLDKPVNVKCLFYMQTHRRVDLNNLLEAVTDLLVHYDVLADDNSNIVASHDGSRVLYDKERPRTEIEITEVE